MLQVGLAGHQRDLHICNRGSGQYTPVNLLSQMGQDQPLPVQVQFILTAGAFKHQTTAPLSRLHQQMDFRIVTQRLEMPHALHRILDGLFIHHTPGIKGDIYAKSLLNQAFQDLNLDFSHQSYVDFT